MRKMLLMILTIIFAMGLQFVQAQEQAEDARTKNLPAYKKVDGLSGNLSSIGSDTLNNMMTFWGEAFSKMYPNVKVAVEGKGSATAPVALAEGTAQLGPMSRKMKNDEIEAFEKKHGFKPSKISVALDSLAVFVNKDCPIKSLSMPEVDAIFSKGRLREYPSDITTWGQIGVKGEWEKQSISTFGRNSASGTYGYFKEAALKKGDFKDTVKEQAGSAAVVRSITEDKMAMGYSGIGYITSGVKALPLSKDKGSEAFEATYENVVSLKYPLSRKLFVYYVRNPDKPLGNLEKEFLKFVLSKEGQNIAIKDGYFPLTKEEVEKGLADLESK